MQQAEQTVGSDQIKETLRASLFGRLQLNAADGSEIVISNRRAQALLAMLCLARDTPMDREFLSKTLWPGRFEAHAKASLRQCLLDLGKQLAPYGHDVLEATRTCVGVRRHSVSTEVDAMETAVERGDDRLVAFLLADIGTKPILDQMDLGDAFNAWLARLRTDAENRLRIVVERAASNLEKLNDRAALAQLTAAWSQRHLGTIAPPGFDGSPDKTRIAVLPFHSVSASEGQDYFADGMVDELITTLGQVPQLRIAGRTSSFHFRGSQLPSAQIAAELRVSHLVEGSVQRQGDQVRIYVHLIDAASGFESWGGRYDGTLDTIFDLQEIVAQAVTAAIGDTLGIAMQPPLVKGITGSKAAYDLYLQGRALCARLFGEGVLDTAVDLLEQALVLDPDFAECWVMLAEAHQLIATYTQCLDRAAASQRMAECANRAIALSPELGYPYALLGVHEWAQKNVVGALDLAYKAYAIEPGNPAVTMRIGSFLIYCGRIKDAEPYVRATVDQDPVDPRKYVLVWAIHMARGELEVARDVGQRIVDLGFPSMYMAIASAALGDHEGAVEQYQWTKKLVNTIIMPPTGAGQMPQEAMDAYWLIAARGICSGQEPDRLVYSQLLEMMYATLPDKGDLAITGPAVFSGNAELLFKSLGEHVSPANMLALVSLWSNVDSICQIWKHPEFIPFAQRIGLAAAWDKYGWPDLLPVPGNRTD